MTPWSEQPPFDDNPGLPDRVIIWLSIVTGEWTLALQSTSQSYRERNQFSDVHTDRQVLPITWFARDQIVFE